MLPVIDFLQRPKKKIRITARENFPFCIRSYSELQGICIGKCINPRGSMDSAAHAHSAGRYAGWICLRFKYQLREKYLLLHEIAHLLTPGHDHSKTWRDMVLKIGGKITPVRGLKRAQKLVWEYAGYTARGKKYYSWDKP